MENLKLAVVYYSSTGNNHQMAVWARAAAENKGSEVRLRKARELAPEEEIAKNPNWKKHYDATKNVAEVSLDDLEWADAILFSVPTRYGNMPAQMKQFMDSTGPLWAKGKLVNKVVTAMTSAMNPHGGQESTLLSLYTTMYHWGAIVVTPGYTGDPVYAVGGNPYGTSVTVDQDANMQPDKDVVQKAVAHQTERLLSIAEMVVGQAEMQSL